MSNLIEEYRELSSQDLIRRNDLGEKCFEDISLEIRDFKRLLDEMISVAERVELPKGLENNLNIYIGQFNSFAKRILEYKFDGDNNFQKRNRLIQDFRNYYDTIFNPQPNQPNNFLPTFNAIKTYGLKELVNLKEQLDEFKTNAQSVLKSVLDASETLKKEASKVTVSDYAKIFEEQAQKYSFLSFKPFKMGSAEKFFSIGLLSLILFTVLIILPGYFSVDNISDFNHSIPILLRRLLVLSVLIYLVRFSFKQYLIYKHLNTINKHRQNTLNSFRLFLESISKDDNSVRDVLMIEVAKAIYEQGKTGFLIEKGSSDMRSPSILELTKLITKTKTDS